MVFEIKLGKEIEREIKMEEIQKTKEDIKEERKKNRKQKDIKLEIILFVIFALILGGTLCLKYIIKNVTKIINVKYILIARCEYIANVYPPYKTDIKIFIFFLRRE